MLSTLASKGCTYDTYIKTCERHGDHCYLWTTAKKNWTADEDFCMEEGGHLASVVSDATLGYILLGKHLYKKRVVACSFQAPPLFVILAIFVCQKSSWKAF